MKRTFSTVAVLAMLLMAVGICVKQTIEFRELIEGSTFAILLGMQALFACLLIASSANLLRKRYERQKKPVSRRPVAVTV